VGAGPSRALWRVDSVSDVRALLTALLEHRARRSSGLATTTA
jgi:hypothetical protein